MGKILEQLNVIKRCRRYGLPLWQCPQVLFLIMGLIIIVTAISVYLIGTRYVENPAIIALIVLAISAILFIIAFVVVKSFERLAEASLMKLEFVSIASHQLRTPISNLKWAVELLMSGRLGRIEKNQVEYFKILKENTGRMKELVNDLLIVSKIETGNLPLKREVISLKDLTEDLIDEFTPISKASNTEIEFESQKDLPKIFTDPKQIRLVIENFLDNAIRYTKSAEEMKGEEKIKISLKKIGKNLRFEIKDNGVGIPKEEQKYIFQKFFRSEKISKKTQGSGLGLFIAKSIIERLKGKIGLKSKEDIGSTFWFTLPIK